MRIWANFAYYTVFRRFENCKIAIYSALSFMSECNVSEYSQRHRKHSKSGVETHHRPATIEDLVKTMRKKAATKEADHIPLPADEHTTSYYFHFIFIFIFTFVRRVTFQ